MADPAAYRERASAVAGVTVWTRVTDESSSWVLPDGCVDVLWNGTHLSVAGPDTTAHLADAPAGTPYAALRFAPGVAPAVLGLAVDAFRDERPELSGVVGASDAERLTDELLSATDPSAVLERWAGGRLARSGGPDRVMLRAAALIGAGGSVADVAADVGLGQRQLNRRAHAAFGYGPKVLAWVLRLQRAVRLLASGVSLTQVAVSAGYFDHAHFAHEVRLLTGRTPSQLAGSGAKRSTPLPSGSRNVA